MVVIDSNPIPTKQPVLYATVQKMRQQWPFNRVSNQLVPLFSSMGWATVGQVASKLAVLVTTVLSARLLTPVEFGIFASMQAVMLLASSLWDMGYSPMISREIAAGSIKPDEVLNSAISFRLALMPLYVLVFFVGWFAFDGSWDRVAPAYMITFVAGTALASSSLLASATRGWLDFRSSTVSMMLGRTVVCISLLIVYLIFPSAGLAALCSTFLLGELVTLGWMARVTRHRVSKYDRTLNPGTRSLLNASWPYAMNGFFTLIYNRAEILVVAALAGTFQAGLYAPASRVQDILMVAPSIAVAGLIPIASRAYASGNSENSGHLMRISLAISAAFALPLALLCYVAAPWLVPAALGQDYAESVTPVRILCLAIPIAALEAPILSFLIAHGRARWSTLVYASALITSMTGMIFLTPRFGANGAAWASMLREPVALTMGIYLARKAGLFSTRSREALPT